MRIDFYPSIYHHLRVIPIAPGKSLASSTQYKSIRSRTRRRFDDEEQEEEVDQKTFKKIFDEKMQKF